MQRNLRSIEINLIGFELLFESADGRRTESVHCFLLPEGERYQIKEITQKHWRGSRKHEPPLVVGIGPLLDSEEEGLRRLALRYQQILRTAERYENTLLGHLKLSE